MNLPIVQTLLARRAPLEYRAAFISLNGMVLRLGQTLGPLIMGLVYLIGGFETIFFLSAGLAAAMIPVASKIVEECSHHCLPAAGGSSFFLILGPLAPGEGRTARVTQLA